MNGVHAVLLEDLERALAGQPVTDAWQKERSLGFGAWTLGGSGSMNIPRMANALALYDGDSKQIEQSAEWWQTLVTREEEGIVLEDGSGIRTAFSWSTFEFFSPLYDAWMWIAEACGYLFASDAATKRALQDALRRRTALWTAASLQYLEYRSESSGKIRWAGPGGLPAGLRGSRLRFWDSNLIGSRAVGLPAVIDKLGSSSQINRMADAVLARTDWLTESEQRDLRAMLAGAPAATWIDGLLTSTVALVPYWLRSGTESVASGLLSFMAGGNTSALWGTVVTANEIDYSFPYSKDRVRSGDPELGRGFAWAQGGRLYAQNLTDAEAARNGEENQYVDSIPARPDEEGRQFRVLDLDEGGGIEPPLPGGGAGDLEALRAQIQEDVRVSTNENLRGVVDDAVRTQTVDDNRRVINRAFDEFDGGDKPPPAV